jgi:6-phosphogluconolactonase
MIQLETLLQQKAFRHHSNQGITICPVENDAAGIALAEELLSDIVDRKTVLYLSGGRTPKALFSQFARAETLEPGAVGMIDERFGQKFHPDSNETMFRDSGILRYLEIRGIPFYPILHAQGREETAELYDEKVRSLTVTFVQSVGILGIGADGHTSSLAPNRPDFTNPMFDPDRRTLFVSEFNDPKSAYKERIGMTILGLSMLDLLVVLVFGEDKKKALDSLFDDGPEEAIPSRIFKRPDIAKKTLFITDQNV